ncbi:hypothetical protein BDZ89DRAFT_604206 [Hymenopellis radicata]|nr:hypothetical protein BDZ89DRAFT_604206 [Hymenopellis radicata]
MFVVCVVVSFLAPLSDLSSSRTRRHWLVECGRVLVSTSFVYSALRCRVCMSFWQATQYTVSFARISLTEYALEMWLKMRWIWDDGS